MLCLKRMLRDRPWENWPCMGFLLIISITIVGIILGIEKLQQDSNVTRPKRSLERDACLKKYGGIELNYTKGSTTSFTFDLCSVIYPGLNSSICVHTRGLLPDPNPRVPKYCRVSGRVSG